MTRSLYEYRWYIWQVVLLVLNTKLDQTNGENSSSTACVNISSIILPQCPPGYELVSGLCYLPNHVPTTECPKDYQLYNNSFCYPLGTKPCVPNIAPMPAVREPSETSTEHRCPPGSVYLQDRCRKIICSEGEYYDGRCLQAACPNGMVWRGRRCQYPEYVTTILEIENIFVNGARNTNPQETDIKQVETSLPVELVQSTTTTPRENQPNTESFTTEAQTTQTHQEIAITSDPQNMESNDLFESTIAYETTTMGAVFNQTTTTRPYNIGNDCSDCCKVFTPRICKLLGKKWLCFHRFYYLCDVNVCTHETIYLRPPEISYKPPMLVMPPNPPLAACNTADCGISKSVNCSGCSLYQNELCSPYCYRYMCLQDNCNYMDQQQYCAHFAGKFGCRKQDGCLWSWCENKYS